MILLLLLLLQVLSLVRVEGSVGLGCDAVSTDTVFGFALDEDTNFVSNKINNLHPKNHHEKSKATFYYKNSVEYFTLKQKFGEGVRHPELCSIAQILSLMSDKITVPSRDEKRSFQGLLGWFHKNWEFVLPFFPFIHLRDENNQIIDGRREFIEKCLNPK
ncbi:hypothetical protein M9Y10_000642 [Tritrichomonas musculus]|uniref:Uncharacterized protein n=1 Tax=Tritrichomonas musculus TaxID=1915356 RepID=A0ABR2L4S6_9EUKA